MFIRSPLKRLSLMKFSEDTQFDRIVADFKNRNAAWLH
jgi:hypothetical protein